MNPTCDYTRQGKGMIKLTTCGSMNLDGRLVTLSMASVKATFIIISILTVPKLKSIQLFQYHQQLMRCEFLISGKCYCNVHSKIHSVIIYCEGKPL